MVIRILILLSLVVATLCCSSLFLTEPLVESKEQVVDSHFQLIDEIRLTKDTLNILSHYKNVRSHLEKPFFQNVTSGLIYREDDKIEKYYSDLSRNDKPEIADIGHVCLASMYSSTKRPEFAAEELSRVKNTSIPFYHVELGYARLWNGEWDFALSCFQKEYQRDPHLRRAVEGLATVYYLQKEYGSISELYTPETESWLKKYASKVYLYRLDLASYVFSEMDSFPFNWTNILASLAVAMLWMFYFQKIDLFDHVLFSPIIATFCISLFITFFCGIFYEGLEVFLHYRKESGFHEFVYCFLGIGIVEEIIKLIPVFICFRIFKSELTTPFAYLSIAAASALGFATLENALYFDFYPGTVIYKRAFLCVSGHIFYTSLIVYGHKIITWDTQKINVKYAFLFFITAVIFHGIYDAFLIVEGLRDLWMFSLLISMVEVYGLYRIINYTINISPNFDTGIRYSKGSYQFFLIAGFTAIYLLEFLLNSLLTGYSEAFDKFMSSFLPFVIMLCFLVSNLSSMDIVKNLRTGILTLIKKFKYSDLQFTKLNIVPNSPKKLIEPLNNIESLERIQFSQKGIYILLNPENAYSGFTKLVLQPYKELISKGYRVFEANLLGVKDLEAIHAPDASTVELSLLGRVAVRIVDDPPFKKRWYERFGVLSTFGTIVAILFAFVFYMNYSAARTAYDYALELLDIKSLSKAYNNTQYALAKDENYGEAKILEAKLNLYGYSYNAVLKGTQDFHADTKRKRTTVAYLRARAYLANNEKEHAMQLFTELLSMEYVPDSTRYLLAKLRFNKKEYDGALDLLGKFRKGKQSDERTRLESSCYMALGRYAEAKGKLLQLRKTKYQYEGQYFGDLGKCYLEEGDTLKACSELSNGVKFNNPDAHTLYGINCVRYEVDTLSVVE